MKKILSILLLLIGAILLTQTVFAAPELQNNTELQ